MTIDRTDRRAFREAIGTLFDPLLVGTGLPVAEFYDHLESEFNGQSPVVCLASGGTATTALTVAGRRYVHNIGVLVYVSQEDPNVDDTIDDEYQAVADIVEANLKTSNWKRLDFADQPSTIEPTLWGGGPYWVETIPLTVESF